MSIVYSEPLVWQASVTTRDPFGCDIYRNMLRVSITLREFPFVKARKPLACRADVLRSLSLVPAGQERVANPKERLRGRLENPLLFLVKTYSLQF